MKFSIVRSTFLEGLQIAQNVVSNKSALQILSHAKLDAENNRIRITTTELDMTLLCEIEGNVEKPGSSTLPVRRVANMIREFPEGLVNVAVGEDDVAHVQSGSTEFKIMGLPSSDFPLVPKIESSACYRIDQGVFREMLRKTSYAVSQDEARRVLNGVLLAFRGQKLTMVATDARRLALVEHEVEFAPEAECEMILPPKAIAELIRLLNNEGDIKIYSQKNQAIFDIGKTQLCAKLLEGVYPNYRQVIPGACGERVVVERELLLAALRRMQVVTSDKSNATKLTFSSNNLTLATQTPEVGEGRDVLPIKYGGQTISIVVNPEYVIDPLRNIDDDEVTIEMNDGHSPLLLKCSIPFLYVLMPLRVT